MTYKKILLLGSGALKIGEAGEFDYSGSQAIKAVKEEGIKIILVNPNIATVQTDPGFADEIYYMPVNPIFVEKIIEKERPDAIMLAFWWQTALNCGLELEKKGILKKYGIKVLWTPTQVIEITEDRKKFNEELDKISVQYARSRTATNESEAIDVVKKIGYPVLVRAAFALGGLGSGFATNERELKELLKKSFSYSPQVIIDESLKGWKELEYEIVRDAADNCIAVCNMENFDPMGIHTGESIVIAPSQTLSNTDCQIMRDIALKTIRHLGIIGECNIQFAYDLYSRKCRVIEVNARLSRSSALASKVTGYPLAYVAAKIALGYTLDEIKNSVTQVTTAFFEPSLDYVVCKIPRWDLDKFSRVDNKIGSEMKSVGEVMSIGRSIEEVIQKALRNLDIGALGLVGNPDDFDYNETDIDIATPKRIFAIARAFIFGHNVEYIHKKTSIDPFFLEKIKSVVETFIEIRNTENILSEKNIHLIKKAKKQGFSDLQIAIATNSTEAQIRNFRTQNLITPVVKKIDTLAGEFPSVTNYLYTTYHGTKSDSIKDENRKKIIILGSGSYRIGCSVEFDWCSVSTLKTLKELGYDTIIVNYNPETVSTDFDSSDRLYFDEISLERVLDIYETEKPIGVIVSMGGQIANNLALKLENAGVHVLWSSPKNIDRAEDRNKFSSLLDTLWVGQPLWAELTSLDEALNFAEKNGYPVIIRPSYVLSGANMRVCSDERQLTRFLTSIAKISVEHPSVISKFELGAKEIEVDWVGQNGELKIYAITEHIENAGVHSGDATVVLPAQKLYIETIRKIKRISKRIIRELNITGPFNIQFLAKDNTIKVIECNVRASRSFPFVSKVTWYNFIDMATQAIMGIDISGDYNTLDMDYVGVKASQFSFHRLRWADPKLGIEMASTGEVWCIGDTLHQAFLTAMISVGIKIPKCGILISLWSEDEKYEFLESVSILQKLWFPLFATKGTHSFFKKHNIECTVVPKISQDHGKILFGLMEKNQIDLIVNTSSRIDIKKEETDGYLLRRRAVDQGISLITNIKIAKLFIESISLLKDENGIRTKSYREFE